MKKRIIEKKRLYYLIEKTINGKNVDYYPEIDDIVRKEERDYSMDAKGPDTYYLKYNAKILDIIKYIKNNTCNYYDLINANCQDFARYLIKSYCEK